MQSELIVFGTALIQEIGKKLADKRKREEFQITEKNGCSDIVTEHDIWVQEQIICNIRAKYPNHGFIGEESEVTESGKEWIWVIDPIDGTSNYSCLGAQYAISVALMRENQIVYGWVYDVPSEILYQGGVKESCLSEEKITAQESLLYMGYKTMQELEEAGFAPYELCRSFRGVRYEGCASLELCKGGYERSRVYFSSHLKIWDFAAAAAILSSKGSFLRAAATENGNYFVCGYSTQAQYEVCRRFIPTEIERNMQIAAGNAVEQIFRVT